MQRPHLRVGRGLKAGRVLPAHGPPTIRLGGPAVQTGIPFSRQAATWLQVQWADGLGAPIGTAPRLLSSEDLKVSKERGRLTLQRAVLAPRLRVGPYVVAFCFRRFLGRLASYKYNPSDPIFRYTEWEKGGRKLWSAPFLALLYRMFDGKHAWFATAGPTQYQLRRLADGALLVRLASADLPVWPAMHPDSDIRFTERSIVCPAGCCVWDLDARPALPTRTNAAGKVAWSPMGDRLVGYTFGVLEEWSRADGFTRRRRLPLPAGSIHTHEVLRLTAAGEVVWIEADSRFAVWHESLPEEVRRLGEPKKMWLAMPGPFRWE